MIAHALRCRASWFLRVTLSSVLSASHKSNQAWAPPSVGGGGGEDFSEFLSGLSFSSVSQFWVRSKALVGCVWECISRPGCPVTCRVAGCPEHSDNSIFICFLKPLETAGAAKIQVTDISLGGPTGWDRLISESEALRRNPSLNTPPPLPSPGSWTGQIPNFLTSPP